MLKNPTSITAIIPAAGKPSNIILHDSNLPDTMLPINGKPVIGYILEDLLERNITKAIIILRKDDSRTEGYVNLKFSKKLNITIIKVNNQKQGLGDHIALYHKQIKKGDGLFIYLADTIYKSKLSFTNNFLVTSREVDTYSKWCIVEKKDTDIAFIDKPENYSGNGAALCGLYFFKNYNRLKKILSDLSEEKKPLGFSKILSRYFAGEPCTFVNAKKWYDCGNIENYQRARIDFLKIRSFNSIRHDPVYGVLIKESKNVEKIQQEITWYMSIPRNLQIFSPRIIDTSIDKRLASYSVEFYGYHSLGDLFVFGSLDEAVWKIIINHTFEVLKKFKTHKAKLAYSAYQEMYVEKTINRIDALKKHEYWENILDQETIIINNKEYSNIKNLVEKLPALNKKLFTKDEMCVIHGDLCLSNILFDTSNRIIKLIDPRGDFGGYAIHGDQKYDLAKQRHSFSGLYDFIVADLFELEELSNNSYTFTIYSERKHAFIRDYFDSQVIKHGYNLENVKLIEALLFLSMIPLHEDNKKRQLAMYLNGVMLIEPFIS
jgi:dTDP-glucose pyrophosphorylase